MRALKEKVKNLLFDGIVVCSIAVIIFVVAEIGFRVLLEKGVIDVGSPDAKTIPWDKLTLGNYEALKNSEAYRGIDWVDDWIAEQGKYEWKGVRYAPYVIWANKPYRNKYIHVNEDGFRSLPAIPKIRYRKRYKVFFFGGSTTAGGRIKRDADLIPTHVCAELNQRLAEVLFDCWNYGHNGYSSFNEINLLVRLLVEGKRPDIIVFYDGVNDVIQRVAFGRPHNWHNVLRWAMSLARDPVEYRRIRIRVAQLALDTSMLIRYATGYMNRNLVPQYVEYPPEPLITDEQVLAANAKTMVSDLFAKYGVINALGAQFGFHPLFLWQPTMFYGNKKLTQEESRLLNAVREFAPSVEKSFELANREYQRALNDNTRVKNLHDLTGAFDRVSESIFLDFAHVSPRGTNLAAKAVAQTMISEFGF